MRDGFFASSSAPAMCQTRIATPVMIATGTVTPSPIARTTPIVVSSTAIRYWPISIARTAGPATADAEASVRVSGAFTRLMDQFSVPPVVVLILPVLRRLVGFCSL